ncbi:uncharacterized protein LOC117306591, partial [Asterias rubens]|uniref:uncharacterized protein LOC117306591 n=1 Tax=Asterias rubens TaxID=7604 RepID=UPI00145568D8
ILHPAPFAGWGPRQCSKINTCESDLARYEEGKTYTYNYHAESSTWINGTSEEKSALVFELEAQIDVISPCELTLQLNQVEVLETGSNGRTTPARNQDLLRSELQDQVLRFAFHDGIVTDVCPMAGETTWALNFKRGFLSAIQDPVTASLLLESGESTVITETDVTGKCSATFSPSATPGLMTKVKDFKNCEMRTKLEGGIQATVLRKGAPLFNILECSQKCEITYESNLVSESSCVEQHTSKPFAREGSGAMTVIKASVDRLRITRASKTPSSSMIDRQTTIFFEHEDIKGDTQPEIIMKAKEILGMLSPKLIKEVGIEMPNLFSNLVTEMRKIETLDGMTQLREFVEGQSEGLVEVFRDALQMCETTPSIETMVTIINEVAASEDEAVIKAFKTTRAMWLTQPAIIRHPTKKMIGSLMPIIKSLSGDESVFFLPISSMINKYCTTENPSCLEDSEVRMAIEYFQQLLGFDCTPTEEVPTLKMLMALKALTNIRRLTTDSKISIINKCFDNHNQDKRTEIRVAALDLVRRLPCKPEYQTYALAMYKNQHFDSELRIAAYRAVMTCPSENIMAAIQEVMVEEQSEQVGSYVWTHLSNLNETTDPQKLSLKKWVQDSGVFTSFSQVDPRKFSRNVELSWYNGLLQNLQMLMSLAKEQTHEIIKNAVLTDNSWSIPTVIGLPLKLAINGTVSMKIRTEGKVDIRGVLMPKKSFEISGIIEPSAAVEISTSMEVMARTTRSGLNHIGRLHSSVSLGGKIQFTDGKAFELKLDVPEKKQNIIDVSSNIYLRRQDESYAMPGIPERLDLSYCSGSGITKYFGVQVCSELALPKSYARKGTPMYPLTGPGRMLVTIEKTDPSLTSWKIEGSYDKDTESVKNVVEITDRFHLMMGAPDTDNPRTFQLDFTYNRNEKDMSLNVISPFKTLDLHGKMFNDELLRKLEVALTMDKTNVYTLDAEVESRPEVVDGDPVINFYPRMDITSPSGNVVKYRSSIAVRDGDQTRVALWMSLDSPKTAMVIITGDVVKTESMKKLRYSTDLQISGRYVNLNVSAAWQKQKRDNIITVDVNTLRRVNGKNVKEVVISTKYTNKTVEGHTEWDLKTEWTFSRFPLLSFLFETEYNGRIGLSEATSKLCYRYNGEECSQDNKVVMGHLLTWESSESRMNEVLNFKLRNPANNINIEIQQHTVRNETHPVDFSFAILNNTSEKQIIQAVISTHTAVAGPRKGAFEASMSSETWRYAVKQGWEFVKSEKMVLNTTLHWKDQMASLDSSYIPTSDEEANLEAHNISSVLTYPLGSFSTNWFVWMQDSDVSSGASMSLIDQQLVAYRFDFTDRSIEFAQDKDRDLVASFNVTSPASPISVAVNFHESLNYKDFGFNITMGTAKVFAIGMDSAVSTEEGKPRTDINAFSLIDIPNKNYRLMYSASSMMSASKQHSVHTATLNNELFYSQSTDYEYSKDYETGRYFIIYETSNNMSQPLPEMGYKIVVSVRDGNHDHQVSLFRKKQPILFAGVKYDLKEMVDEDFMYRREFKVILRTPLAICKDVSFNVTVDQGSATTNIDTRLMYFPNQERPLGMVINLQDKSNGAVTHKDLTVTLKTIQRTVTSSNMLKFDLNAGTLQGASSIEFGTNGVLTTEKFEVSITYTNDTREEEKSHSATLLLTSPDNTIQTDVIVVYTMDTSVSTTFSVAVSQNTLFSFSVLAKDESDGSMKLYDVDTNVELLERRYRLHTVYNEAVNSFNPNVKLYRGSEPKPIAEVDLSYTKVNLFDEVHTTILVLSSEDFEPLTITTVYNYNTDTKEVSLTIEPSEGENVKFNFYILSGSTETESITYNTEFSITNTYMPDRSFVVVTRYGSGESGCNLNTDLQISESRMMNLMCNWDKNSPKKTADFQLTFPQLTEYPALSKMKLRLGSEIQEAIQSREAAFLWGELTDDEMISVALTTERNQVRIVLIHPMNLEPLPKEIRVVLRQNDELSDMATFDINVMDNMDESIMMLAGSYSLINSRQNNRRATLTFSRRNHQDIQATLDAAVQLENTIFSTSLVVKYSEDEQKLVEAMLQIQNTSSSESVGYDLDVSVRHPITGLDMSTAFNFLNNNKAIVLGMEGEALLAEDVQPDTFEIKWDKVLKKYSITSNNPMHEMLLTGQFEDRSYAEHQIYRVTMVNSLDGKDMRSMVDFNSQSKEISYIAHINPGQFTITLLLSDHTKWAEYWEQFRIDSSETTEELRSTLDRLRERFSTLAESLKFDGSEYVDATNQRVRSFYKNNITPLIKELKDLFKSLIEKHNSQMDLLFPIRHPYGDDFLIPELEAEPEVYEPKYNTEGEDPIAEKNIFLTSIKDVRGETVLSEDSLLSTMTRERLRRLELVQSIETLWTATKEEVDAMVAKIEASFKGSAFYADLTEQWEELKERFPVGEWRQEAEAKFEEIRESEDVQRLIAVFNEIKGEIELAREANNENILRIQEKMAATLKEYNFDILDYFKYPMYEVIKYDIENGEIIVLYHLPAELHSLQTPPESYRRVEMTQRLQEMIAEVRERSKNTLGDIRMADGSLRSMYELMLSEPMLLYREGNFTAWFQGEKIKMERRMWNAVHFSKVYLNPINWLPPHEANGMIIGSNHFMTYDRTHYDFSSGCSYLLAHDFIDGNFTVVVDYERDLTAGGRSKSIVLYLNDTDVYEIKQDFTVSHGKQFLEMPFQHGHTTVMRYINSIRIHNTNGVTITCEIAQDICTVDISGWYYGKTAGLLGTYNYNDLDDMTNSEGDMSRHLDEFTRSWKVGKRCAGSEIDSLPECNKDPHVEENAVCAEHFLNEVSTLTKCLGVVDPAPYYAMCASNMCQLTADDRKKAACVSVKAYVNECNRMMVGITVPKSCVVCDSPVGEYGQDEIRVLSEAEQIQKSADVILIVEEKECNKDLTDKIGDIVDMYDTELKNVRQFTDNRFGIVGFGGEGVHDLPHIHTIDGAIFNEKRRLRMQGLTALEFSEDGSNNTFDAILAAANYPFRAGVAKNIVLLSCSDCQRAYHMEKTYADVSSMLMRQGIQFNLLLKADLQLVPTRAKNNSPKNQVIYGIDNRTVFTNKALNSGTLFGDKTIRKLINEPINQCALLAFETGGAVFDSTKIAQKKFVDVLTQRMVEHTQIEECQICSCKAYNDGVGRSVCESCDIASGPNWYFEMQRTFAETDYYSRLGLQTVVDYINVKTAEVPVNKTPKELGI